MGSLIQDLRFGLRMLRKNPGFTTVAVLTLAVGIGANTAIFSVVNAVLLRPLPGKDSERLVMVGGRTANQENRVEAISGPDLADFRDQARSYEEMAYAWGLWKLALSGAGSPQMVNVGYVSWNYLSMLGFEPFLGRNFTPEDDPHVTRKDRFNTTRSAPPRALILSYGFWQRQFGGDPSVLDRAVLVYDVPSVIVGVLPPNTEAFFPTPVGLATNVEAWTNPQGDPRRLPRRNSVTFTGVGKLRPGVSVASAQGEADAVSESLREQYLFHKNNGFRLEILPLHRELVKDVRGTLLTLLGVVGFVLLIACANVGSLLLARAVVREKEFALRAALGANRVRLVRQLLTESALLSLMGAGAGLLLAQGGIQLLLLLKPVGLPRLQNVAIEGSVLGFTVALSLAATFLFGIIPAVQFSRPNLNRTLKEGGRSPGGVAHNRLRSLLVVCEVALSLVLLIAAGLMLRSFAHLNKVDPGFNPENVLTAHIVMPVLKYDKLTDQADFVRQLEARLSVLPGVESIGMTYPAPLSVLSWVRPYETEETAGNDSEQSHANYRPITPDYFRAMGMKLLRGRNLEWADSDAGRLVVIVDESLAGRVWPGDDPIGQRLRVEIRKQKGVSDAKLLQWAEVVGVVGNVRTEDLIREGREAIYLPFPFHALNEVVVAIRTSVAPSSMERMIRQEIEALDKDVAVHDARPMQDYIADSIAPLRFSFLLMGLFSLVALVVAAVGLYGVISYSVSQRTQEIGIRMALGAQPRDILGLVVSQGLVLTFLGIAIGLVSSLGLTRFLASQLFGVTPTDPATFAGISLLFIGVALFACYIPARRATKVDPLVALRHE